MPFTLIGRDDACDVTLTDADVNPRHAWLQVLGGRVFAVDLGSRTGLGWSSGPTGSGWFDPADPVQIGPFQVCLRSPVSTKSTYFPDGYSPLHSDPSCVRSRAAATLDFRNGRRAKDRWVVNRLITLVGRAPECKVRLTADDIVGYHCGLVLTAEGLWVVDLSGRGVVVNGERMRVSPLPHGAELWVGRFLIAVQYPGAALTPPEGKAGNFAPPNPFSGFEMSSADISPDFPEPAPTRSPSILHEPAPPPEDEVPLGFVAPQDGAGLPSSHIMADAFQLWAPAAVAGPLSHPILVGSSNPSPTSIPVPATRLMPSSKNGDSGSEQSSSVPVPLGRLLPPGFDVFDTPPPVGGAEAPTDAVGTLLRQLGDTQTQFLAQFQNSLLLMVHLFECLRREQLPAMQHELARIQELNAAMAQLQSEVTARSADLVHPTIPLKASAWVTAASPTPLPDHPMMRTTGSPAALRAWILDRINTIQSEWQIRLQSLVGVFTEKSG
jgi:pSer/pThr/pTyr-binding forkhead associated (FHA) protein